MALHRSVEPTLDRPPASRFTPDGWVGQRVRATAHNWLVPAPASNPGMVEMFAHRDNVQWVNGRFDHGDPVPWAGEFAGKYLISAAQTQPMIGPDEVTVSAGNVVAELIANQGTDGSLGMPLAWDLWGQYHVLLGLLRWCELNSNPAALTACSRASALAVARYLARPGAVAQDHPDDAEKNQAIAHALVLVHEQTGDQDALALATALAAAWVAGGNFLTGVRRRWESLHDVQAQAELYLVTGDSAYQSLVTQIWHHLRDTERHADGGFGGGEATTGDPNSPLYIETCATVAWMALSIDVLRLTGDPDVADELELSLFNAILAAQSVDGRLWTYHTPPGGVPIAETPAPPQAYIGYRLPAYYDLDWQHRDRYPQLSCCETNGPRGLTCLSDWAVMRSADAVVVNFYGPSTTSVQAPDGTWLTLSQQTQYPSGDGVITIGVEPRTPSRFTLRLRIPKWSTRTRVQVNGDEIACTAGSYCDITRIWVPQDRVTLELDMGIRIVAGTQSAAGKVALYRGPILLSYDARLNHDEPWSMPRIRVSTPTIVTAADTQVAVTFPDDRGGTVTLCDYASAGQPVAGNLAAQPNPFVPWEFSRSNGDVIAPRIILQPDGTVAGYANNNEARWGFEGDDLTFYASSGAVSTRFTMRTERYGRQMLSGVLQLDRSVRHILTQIDDGLAGRTWQFWRRQREGDTVLLPRVTLRPDGTFDRPTHPNESRWAVVGGRLTFLDANNDATTIFDAVHMANGRPEYQGRFLPDDSITHMLSEVDLDVTARLWRFWRVIAGQNDVVIDDKVRLLGNGRVDGHCHPNEHTWGYEGDDLAFYGANGAVTTRFTTFRTQGNTMIHEGTFLPISEITHRLEERAAGVPPGSYVSWLERAPRFDRERIDG
jgi:mannose-6-phosphate isomerase-like protein (cupin superfamily)